MKNRVQKSPLYGLRCTRQFGPVMLALWLGLSCASAFPLLSSNQLVFVNVDHAPMGTCSTMTYGWKGQICGIGTSSGAYPYWNGGGGVLVALSGSSGLQLLPFVASASSISTNASFFSDGGPYSSLTNGLVGASFVDSALSNGATYYYILTATNPIGESLPSSELSATPVPSVSCNISAALSASGLTVSWPSNYVGWLLQTNTAGLGNPAAWQDVSGSLANSQMIFPTSDRSIPTRFFRLRHP